MLWRWFSTAALIASATLAGVAQTATPPRLPVVSVLQSLPIPASPYELISTPPQTLAAPKDRAAALGLLDRARVHFTLMTPSVAPSQMDVSFEAGGALPDAGMGQMTQTWINGQAFAWTAQINGNVEDRYGSPIGIFSSNPRAPVTLPVQMVREALLWPIRYATSARLSMRTADVSWNGTRLTCVLLSRPGIPEPASNRGWLESEFCIDPASGLLQIASQAPGIYEIYDYSDPANFDGHTLARDITIVEGGATVLRIRLDSLADASGTNPASLQPTAAMIQKGRSFELGFPILVATAAPMANGAGLKAVVVQATVDRAGKVDEAVALQQDDPALAQAAVARVRSSRFFSAPRAGQREFFDVVCFTPPATDGPAR